MQQEQVQAAVMIRQGFLKIHRLELIQALHLQVP